MSDARRRLAAGYLVFVAVAALVAIAVALIGRGVLDDRFGNAAAAAWSWGCGVSFVASVASALLVALSEKLPLAPVTVALGSMLLRLVLLVLVGSGVALTFALERRSFLLALAFSYLALLVVDTVYALSVSARRHAVPAELEAR